MTGRTDRGRARPRRWLLAAAGALVLLVAGAAWLLADALGNPGLSRERFEEETGLRLVRVALAAGGGLIDVRYQVLDSDKAAGVHEPGSRPKLVDEASGLIVDRPWMDHHKRKELHLAVTYYELLVNPGAALRRGSTVTLEVGAARLPGITIE